MRIPSALLHVRGWALGANGQLTSKISAVVDGIVRINITNSMVVRDPTSQPPSDGQVPKTPVTMGRCRSWASHPATTSCASQSSRTTARRFYSRPIPRARSTCNNEHSSSCSDSVRVRIGRCSCFLSLSASSPSGCVAYAYHNELDIGPNETPAFIS